MTPQTVLHQNLITNIFCVVMYDLVIRHRSVWPNKTLPSRLYFMSCQQAASGVTSSEPERCFTWISVITQRLRQQPKQHVPTVRTRHRAKITVDAIDINIFPPVVGPLSYSFVCLFSFWSSGLCCAKVAFVCDGPAEQLS